MQKLTAIKVKALLHDLSGLRTIREELFRQALEIALPVLEQQERGDDGWIEWGGGDCPVPKGTLVDIRLRDGGEYLSCQPDAWVWVHRYSTVIDPIIAYRVVQQERERGEEE